MRSTLFTVAIFGMVACSSGKAPNSGLPEDGGASDGGGDGGVSQAAVTACMQIAQTRCTRLSTCEPGTFQDRYGSEATCEAQMESTCENGQIAPGTGQSVTALSACNAALSAESCEEELSGMTLTACMPPAGTVATGQPCTFNGQCQTQFCEVPLNSVCGTCQATPAAGSTCTTNGCGTGQACVATSNTCQTTVALGATCSDTAPCAAGLACVTARAGKTCVELGQTAGTACTATNVATPDCDKRLGLVCDVTTHVCLQVTYAPAGQSCAVIDGGYVDCQEGVCSVPARETVGTCDGDSAVGASCDPTGAAPCLSPGICVTATGSALGTCQIQNGANCH